MSLPISNQCSLSQHIGCVKEPMISPGRKWACIALAITGVMLILASVAALIALPLIGILSPSLALLTIPFVLGIVLIAISVCKLHVLPDTRALIRFSGDLEDKKAPKEKVFQHHGNIVLERLRLAAYERKFIKPSIPGKKDQAVLDLSDTPGRMAPALYQITRHLDPNLPEQQPDYMKNKKHLLSDSELVDSGMIMAAAKTGWRYDFEETGEVGSS